MNFANLIDSLQCLKVW